MVDEAYPDTWAKVVLMVSPDGEMHAVGGDREEGDGDTPYIGLERVEARLKGSDLVIPEKTQRVIEAAEAWADADMADEHSWNDFDQALFGAVMEYRR